MQRNKPMPIQDEQPPALPEETLLHVFSFLSHEDRTRAGLACQEWHRLSKDKFLPSLSEEYKVDYFNQHRPMALSSQVHRGRVYQSLQHFSLSERAHQPVQMGVIGQEKEKAKHKLITLKRPSHITMMTVSEESEREAFEKCDFILFYPDKTKNTAKEIQDLFFRHRWYKSTAILFIVNIDHKSDYAMALSIRPRDSLLTIYSRMLASLQVKHKELAEKLAYHPQKNDNDDHNEKEVEGKSSHRCVIS